MRCKAYIILTVLFLFLPEYIMAEETNGRKTGVTGFVLNQDKEPIANAKVTLLSRTFKQYTNPNGGGLITESDEGEQTTFTDSFGHYSFQVDSVRENGWLNVSADGYPDHNPEGYYTLKLREGSETEDIIMVSKAHYRTGQWATIILPTTPDISLGRFFCLDRVENDKVVFERELNPQADIPYVIIPDKDFDVPCDTILNQTAGVTAVDGAYLKGYYTQDIYSSKESEYFVMLDNTTDCYYLGSMHDNQAPLISTVMCPNRCRMGANRAVLVLDGYNYTWSPLVASLTWREDWFFKDGLVFHDSSTGETFSLQPSPIEEPTPQTAAIAGFVVNQEKQPVANAKVQLQGDGTICSAETDDYGHFFISTNDVSNRYKVAITSDGYPEQFFLDGEQPFVFSSGSLSRTFVLSQDVPAQREYKSLLSENRIWFLAHELPFPPEEWSGVQQFEEDMLKGDTIIDGIHFKQVFFKSWNVREEKPTEWMSFDNWIGEKGETVYLRTSIDGPFKIFPVVDFSMKEGDTFPSEDRGWVEYLVVSASDTIIDNSVDKSPRRCIKLSQISTENPQPPFYIRDVWMEGIGSYYYGINAYLRIVYGSKPKLVRCTEGDDVLYEHPDAATIMSVNRPIFEKSDADFSIYDLHGRRLTTKPQKGVYIQNGRKYVVE